jgi:hypothetical protein
LGGGRPKRFASRPTNPIVSPQCLLLVRGLSAGSKLSRIAAGQAPLWSAKKPGQSDLGPSIGVNLAAEPARSRLPKHWLDRRASGHPVAETMWRSAARRISPAAATARPGMALETTSLRLLRSRSQGGTKKRGPSAKPCWRGLATRAACLPWTRPHCACCRRSGPHGRKKAGRQPFPSLDVTLNAASTARSIFRPGAASQ